MNVQDVLDSCRVWWLIAEKKNMNLFLIHTLITRTNSFCYSES